MPKPNPKKKLGELLVDAGVISEENCQQILKEQKSRTKKLGELLVEKGLCSEHNIASALSSQLGLPFIDLKITPIEPTAIKIIPEAVAKRHLIVPISVEGKELHIAMLDPFSYEALEDVRFASGYEVKPYIATKSDIIWSIKKHYNLASSLESVIVGMNSKPTVDIIQEVKDEQPDISDVSDLKKQSSKAPIIKMVNMIIVEAVDQRASDIHIDPAKDNLIIRNRVDGTLRQAFALPKWVQAAVVSRIKIMAGIDISEKRLPQDGKISVRINNNVLDLRVSTLPTKAGEKVVIRVLDTQNSLVSIEQLGMEGQNKVNFTSLVSRPQGIILVTGPTGSGKTTTLYSALAAIKSGEKNIITVEDPVEYELEGISQVSVNDKIGLTFASSLRSILRQDPDVVMVGEMRDIETAKIAMQAALTGHLVLSTIHTNSAVATVTRLRDFGIPSYLIASTIIGIIAQRLVRVICPACKKRVSVEKEKLIKLGLSDTGPEELALYSGAGCPKCAGVGYKGRQGIYEILTFTEKIQSLIAANATEAEIRQVALQQGMKPLGQAGLDKIIKGETSVEELLRVIFIDQDFTAEKNQEEIKQEIEQKATVYA